MALQHHFVVVIENGKPSIDWASYTNLEEIRTYDTELDEWVDYDYLTPEGLADLEEAEGILETIVEMHNDPKL